MNVMFIWSNLGFAALWGKWESEGTTISFFNLPLSFVGFGLEVTWKGMHELSVCFVYE